MGHWRKKMISILLTNRCNMACKYCYLSGGQECKNRPTKKIDLDFAKIGISDYFSMSNTYAVRFFADGEPTLEFDTMKDIYSYAKEISEGKCIFELQSNGFFSDAIAKWIKDNINIVFISYDGLPEINDTQRCLANGEGTSSVIERNIKTLLTNPKCQVGVRATITNNNVYYQKEMIDYFYSIGVKILFSDLVFAPIGGSTESFNVNYTTFVDTFVDAKEYAKHKYGKDFFYGSMYCANFDEKVCYACRSCLPTPHLTPDGYVTCCDFCVTSSDENMRELIYGTYDPVTKKIFYDQRAIDHIRTRTPDNIPECRNCEVKDYCAGACLGEALNETGDFYGVKKDACNAIKYMWEKMGKKTIDIPFLHP